MNPIFLTCKGEPDTNLNFFSRIRIPEQNRSVGTTTPNILLFFKLIFVDLLKLPTLIINTILLTTEKIGVLEAMVIIIIKGIDHFDTHYKLLLF